MLIWDKKTKMNDVELFIRQKSGEVFTAKYPLSITLNGSVIEILINKWKTSQSRVYYSVDLNNLSFPPKVNRVKLFDKIIERFKEMESKGEIKTLSF